MHDSSSGRDEAAADARVVSNPRDSEPLGAGVHIDGFEIRRLIAQGGFGRVYLARDIELGRFVALKILRSERLSAAQQARLVVEARLTAQLSHPNVVAIHGLGRAYGVVYIAMEFIRGETLADRLKRDRLGLQDCLRIGRDIALGLAAAHEKAIVHRDVKPANIMLPEDGRVRVVDFGLAITGDAWDGSLAGTRRYLPPEVLAGKEPTPPGDIFALGLTLAEMLMGRHPCPDASVDSKLVARAASHVVFQQGVRDEIRVLVESCLAPDPSDRPSAADVGRLLDEALDPRATTATSQGEPFRGLLPYHERHASEFFGRDQELTAFVERARSATLLLVVGASGVGKSSFVQAGVIPRLRERGPTDVTILRPGRTPFLELAARLDVSPRTQTRPGKTVSASAPGRYEGQADSLRASPWALGRLLHERARARNCRIVLVIDQLEELVTHPMAEAERLAFADAITLAASEPGGPVMVIATVRDDYLGAIMTSPALVHALPDATVLFPPRREALRAILSQPLQRVGYRYDDPRLVDEMLTSVEHETAALPLLQFACECLWAERDEENRTLRRVVYDRLGGIAGALSGYADRVIQQMPPAWLPVARALALRLVDPQGARLGATYSELVDGLGPDAVPVLERLIGARLVATRRSSGDAEAGFELCHESLARTWPTLRGWLEDGRREHALLADASVAAALWDRRGSLPDDVWVGEAVRTAARYLLPPESKTPPRVRRFLEAGLARDRRVVARRRWLAMAGIAVLVVAGAASWIVATRIDRARADIGESLITVSFFDWDPNTYSRRPTLDGAAQPTIEVWAPDREHPERPGRALSEDIVTVEPLATSDGSAWHFALSAPGGPAFLRIGRGPGCAPSWIPVGGLPGYADRESAAPPVFELEVPTCRASDRGLVRVPAGPFVSSGAGVPPPEHASYIQPERTVTVPEYRIGLTEVPNVLFDAFRGMSPTTGIRVPVFPDPALTEELARPDRPATGLDWTTADVFCRYLGLRLPTALEWEKAARGGLQLEPGSANSAPRRSYPWSDPARTRRCANLSGDQDGYPAAAPVTGAPECAGPYGLHGQGGNVWEWTSTHGLDSADTRVARGGGWDSDPKLEEAHLAYENTLNYRYFAFTYGVRCAADAIGPP